MNRSTVQILGDGRLVELAATGWEVGEIRQATDPFFISLRAGEIELGNRHFGPQSAAADYESQN